MKKLKLILLICCLIPMVFAQKIHKTHKPIHRTSLDTLTFDFNYSGDVTGILQKLKDYSPDINILKPLGQIKPLEVNISLQSAKFDDIADAIATQTNNQVTVIFATSNNSIRLNYTGVLDVGEDAVHESLKWQDGGNPKPVLKQDGIVKFPYGEYQPVVICQPLHLCDIELQAGEDIQGVVIGDSERWNDGDQGIPIVYSGVSPNMKPHLVLKPSQSGLDTSLMVTTSKRTYMLRLKSAQNGYVARVGFYYPQDITETFSQNKDKLKMPNTTNTIATNPDINMPLVNLSKVNYSYTIGSGDYDWRPTHIFDDGVSVYIQFPPNVMSNSLPGLCVLVDGDDSEQRCELVNFRFNDNFYIVDKLFKSAKLVNGYGDYVQTITLTRNPERPNLWQRLFGSGN